MRRTSRPRDRSRCSSPPPRATWRSGDHSRGRSLAPTEPRVPRWTTSSPTTPRINRAIQKHVKTFHISGESVVVETGSPSRGNEDTRSRLATDPARLQQEPRPERSTQNSAAKARSADSPTVGSGNKCPRPERLDRAAIRPRRTHRAPPREPRLLRSRRSTRDRRRRTRLGDQATGAARGRRIRQRRRERRRVPAPEGRGRGVAQDRLPGLHRTDDHDRRPTLVRHDGRGGDRSGTTSR